MRRTTNWPAAPCLSVLVVLAHFFHVSSTLAFAGGPESTKTVVVLDPDANDGRPGSAFVDRGIRTTFAAGAPGVEVHNEHLDLSRFADASYQQHLAEFLRRKYAGRKVDLVIAGLAPGLDFALKYREIAFPGVPIVHCAVDQRELDSRELPADVAGIPIRMDLAPTLDLALQLHPHTQRVYVITGRSKFDLQWEAESRQAFHAYRDKVQVIHLAALPLEQLLEHVAKIPEHSIVYYLHVFEDGDGKILIPAEVLRQVAAHAPVPIYGHVDTYVGRGIVGGRVFSFESAGQNAAALGLRILAGEKIDPGAIREASSSTYMFDGRQLRRWNIRTEMLPPGSVVRNHEPSFWELYRWHILGVISLCIVESLLIIALLVQRASRRRAEHRFQQAVRQNQAELRELTGRLLRAQETERRRIARELHDDLNQSLALLAVELDMLRQQPPQTVGQAGDQIQMLSDRVKQLSSTVHDLSHELHPASLEQLGLVAAVRGLCHDMSQHHGLAIEFTPSGPPDSLPLDVALCLYRVVQESLQNVVKHSAARSAVVALDATVEMVCLRIVDQGKGFDPASLDHKAALGLVSMRERLYLVGGQLAIDSQPGAGTRIEAQAPLRPQAAPPPPTPA